MHGTPYIPDSVAMTRHFRQFGRSMDRLKPFYCELFARNVEQEESQQH